MRVTLDADGRVVIPPEIRDAAGLGPGAEFDVRVRDGIVELARVELPVRLERRKFLLVAVPEIPVDPMTAAEVDAVRDALLTERSSQ